MNQDLTGFRVKEYYRETCCCFDREIWYIVATNLIQFGLLRHYFWALPYFSHRLTNLLTRSSRERHIRSQRPFFFCCIYFKNIYMEISIVLILNRKLSWKKKTLPKATGLLKFKSSFDLARKINSHSFILFQNAINEDYIS